MRLTSFSDYGLRVLLYAQAAGGRLVTIEETARHYAISRAHLMKVVNHLVRVGFLRGVRGRSGGFALAMPPAEIRLGAVLRATEPDFALVECFAGEGQCRIGCHCRFPAILDEALAAFLGVLDRYTLADLALHPELLGLDAVTGDAGGAGPAPAVDTTIRGRATATADKMH